MTYYMNKSIPARLNHAKETILIAQSDSVIKDTLARFGVSEEDVAIGYQKVELASDYETDQRAQLGAQVAATAALTKSESALRRKFDADRKVVRLVLSGDPELYELFRLRLRVSRNREGFLYQAIHFYREVIAHEALLTILESKYKITKEVLEVSQQELFDFEQTMQEQQYRRGQARVATQKRRAAMKDLDDWMRAFIRVARVAFKDDPKQLEKLGIVVHSSS